MKKIGFIGAYDKTDMLLNIAKILTIMKKMIIVIILSAIIMTWKQKKGLEKRWTLLMILHTV